MTTRVETESPQILAAFWLRVSESGLIPAEQLAALRREPALRGHSATECAAWLVSQRRITQFQADRLLEGRSRGFFFDHYKLTDLLGFGGMGSVYQAEDTRTGEPVALKLLRESLRTDDGMHARFLQEARIGLKLQHPHIIRTFELGSAGGLPYVVMEYVPGPNLLELLLIEHRLPWGRACDLIRQAALGLDYAHRLGLVHRDLKPQNLLIDASGHVRLLDFGLAMLQEGVTGDEFSMAMIFGHESVGTAEYSAPEQIDNSLGADARSDIYGLGATLYAALTGTTPFQAETTAAMLQAHRDQRLRSVREYVPSIPEGVAAVVTQMLARNPADRFATAAEVADALLAFADPGPIPFDYPRILAERQRDAKARQAQLSRERHSGSGLAHSTARPARHSSVAQNTVAQGVVKHEPVLKPSTSQATRIVDHLAAGGSTASTAVTVITQPLGLLTSPTDGQSFPLWNDRIILGRSHEAGLQVDDAAVSGKHAELRFDGYHWWLTDLGSRNGTSVNGRHLTKETSLQAELHSGDEFVIGHRVRFRLTYGAETDPAPAPTSSTWLWWLMAVTLLGTTGLALLGWWVAR